MVIPLDELIVRVARALARLPPLRLLGCMTDPREKSPTELARELGTPPNVVSDHLRVLEAAALIQRRRSGRKAFCQPKSPYEPNAPSGGITHWLGAILRKSGRTRPLKHSTVREL